MTEQLPMGVPNAAQIIAKLTREGEQMREALQRINNLRTNCRGADHMECAELFGKCLDIAAVTLSAIRKARNPT